MYILNVLMLGNYGKILKIGLEYYTTLTLKFQILIKVFGEKYNDRLKRIIVISIKDVIYQKRKKGDQLCLSDVKRAILKNLHIIRQGLTLSTVPSSGTSNIDCRASTSVQLLFWLTSRIIRRIICRVITGPVRSSLLKKMPPIHGESIHQSLGLSGDPNPTQAMKIWEPTASSPSQFLAEA